MICHESAIVASLNQLSLTLSIVIVSFNTKEKLRKCLSCLDLGRDEVIVVDNASSDGSAEMVQSNFPEIKLVANSHNVGFGKANNQGIDIAKGDLILFLNSDAYAKPNSLENLVSAFDDPNVVAAGPKLLNLDGSLQESVAARLTLANVFLEQTYLDVIARRLGKGYWRTGLVQDSPINEVDQVMGAAMIMRTNLGLKFDERFFLYCEDTELCHRLASFGKIVYVNDAEMTHELGSSSVDSRWKSVARYNLGKELYFRIHHGAFQSGLCWLINRLGAFLRLVAGVILSPFKQSGREKMKIFWKVLFVREEMVIPREHRSQ
jgi:N-acetylglucosaminyl-diphospho-decaprenol L-rhamnosyltransferase